MSVLKVQKRIMPGTVRRAYARKGLKAVVGSFRMLTSGDTLCGCALSATFLSKKELERRNGHDAGNVAISKAVKWGCTEEYVHSFINGFDGFCPLPKNDEQRQGHADGQKTIQLIRKHNLVVDGF